MPHELSAELYDAIYSYKDYAGEVVRIRDVIEARRAGARTLLDVACGTGKHLELLREHFAVEGLDLSEEQLAVARRRLPDVALHRADMTSFGLGRRFDAVICLFSAIGYLRSVAAMCSAVASMARHLEPGGVLVVEPWLTPDQYRADGTPHVRFVDEPDLKIARMNVAEREGDLAVMDMHHLVGRPGQIDYFVERMELYLFSDEQYREAFRAAGLVVEHDPEGLIGRGLYVGVSRAR